MGKHVDASLRPPVNRHRGEVAAVLDGRPFTLCLTLRSLAELESAFGVTDLGALARRFSSGAVSARDMEIILAAGLRGGGHEVAPDSVGEMRIEGGAAGFARLCGELLAATFGNADGGAAGEGDA